MRWKRLLAIVAAFGLFIAACGDDDDDTGTDDETEEPTDETDGTEDGADDEDGEDEADDEEATGGESLTVTAVDYGYEGLPETIAAGTTLSLQNSSEAELHEIVALRLPDDETRSVEELLQLPEEEQAAFEQLVSDVIIALPGQTDAPGPVVGDAVLDEPGRYAIICFIPTGVDPQEYLQAAQEAEGGPPQIEGAGPPHFTQGMFAEVTVE